MSTDLLTVDEVAERLDAPKSFVYRLTSEHRIRFVRVGRSVRFRPEWLDEWLEREAAPVRGHEPRPRGGRPRARDRRTA